MAPDVAFRGRVILACVVVLLALIAVILPAGRAFAATNLVDPNMSTANGWKNTATNGAAWSNSYSGGINTLSLITKSSAWEHYYKAVPVSTNSKYRLSFKYRVNTTFTSNVLKPSTTWSPSAGIGLFVSKVELQNKQPGATNILNNVAGAAFATTASSTWYEKTFDIDSGTNTTLYLLLNGYLTDGRTYSNFIDIKDLKFEKYDYIVKYNSNGGSGSMADQYFMLNEAQNLRANSFSRSNCIFAGWNTEADGTGVSYSDGQNVTNVSSASGSTVTLYAQWKYKVTFKSGSTTMGEQYFELGKSQKLTPESALSHGAADSAYGWSFAGWTTATSSQNVLFTDGQSVSITDIKSPAAPVTLYAIYERNAWFQYYDSADATSPTWDSHTQYYRNTGTSTGAVTSVDTFPLYASSDFGWTPQGWAKSDSTTTVWAGQTGASVKSVAPAVTDGDSSGANCYAIYSRQAKIVYDGNGATGTATTSPTTGTQRFNVGKGSADALSLTLAANRFTKAGAAFKNWAAGSTTGTEYAPSSSFEFPYDQWTNDPEYTMYALWDVDSYTVTFKTGNTVMGTQSFEYGESKRLTAESSLSGRPVSGSGWVFAGWAKTYNTTTPFYTDAQQINDIAGDTTLYAVYKRDVSFTYYPNATAVTTTTNNQTQYYYNTSATAASAGKVSTYALSTQSTYKWAPKGWSNSASDTTIAQAQTGAAVQFAPPVSATPEYFAIYAREAGFTYDANGGTGSTSKTTTTQWFIAGAADAEAAAVTTAVNGFTKTGHDFECWSPNPNASSRVDYAATTSYSLENTKWASEPLLTLYACWNAAGYDIVFKAGSKELGRQEMQYDATTQLTPVDPATLKLVGSSVAAPVDPSHGWGFAGWTDEIGKNVAKYQNSEAVKNLTTAGGTVTLYAIYKRDASFTYFKGAAAASPTTDKVTQYYNNTAAASAEASSVTSPALVAHGTLGWTPGGWAVGSTTDMTPALAYTSATTYTPADTIDPEYYAVYSRPVTLDYDGNGADGGSTSSTPGTQRFNAGGAAADKLELTLASNGFTKSGASFDVWAAGDASGPKSAQNTKFTFPNTAWTDAASYDMFAVWKANAYKVIFKSGSTQMGTEDFDYGTAKALTVENALNNKPVDAADGWTFVGWTDDPGSAATSPTYTDGQSVKDLTSIDGGTVELFAIYKRDVTFTYYDGPAATSTSVRTQTQHWRNYAKGVASATAITAPALTVQTNFGWSPLGWVNGSSSSTALAYNYKAETQFVPSGTDKLDFYARYARTAGFTYDGYFPTSGTVGDTTTTQYMNAGAIAAEEAKVTTAANGFTKLGYDYAGWCSYTPPSSATHAENALCSLENTAWTTPPLATLYAYWTEAEFSVTARTSQATVKSGGAPFANGKFPYGSLVVLTAEPDAHYSMTGSGWTVTDAGDPSKPVVTVANTPTLLVFYMPAHDVLAIAPEASPDTVTVNATGAVADVNGMSMGSNGSYVIKVTDTSIDIVATAEPGFYFEQGFSSVSYEGSPYLGIVSQGGSSVAAGEKGDTLTVSLPLPSGSATATIVALANNYQVVPTLSAAADKGHIAAVGPVVDTILGYKLIPGSVVGIGDISVGTLPEEGYGDITWKLTYDDGAATYAWDGTDWVAGGSAAELTAGDRFSMPAHDVVATPTATIRSYKITPAAGTGVATVGYVAGAATTADFGAPVVPSATVEATSFVLGYSAANPVTYKVHKTDMPDSYLVIGTNGSGNPTYTWTDAEVDATVLTATDSFPMPAADVTIDIIAAPDDITVSLWNLTAGGGLHEYGFADALDASATLDGAVHTGNYDDNSFNVGLVVPITLDAATHPGYRFVGWSGLGLYGNESQTVEYSYDVMRGLVKIRGFDGAGAEIATGYVALEKLTFRANWEIESYAVTFDPNTADTVEGMPLDQQVDYRAKASAPNMPTRAGYVFDAWCTRTGADPASYAYTPYDFDTPVTADTQLFATWKPVSYPIVLHLNGGVLASTGTLADEWTVDGATDTATSVAGATEYSAEKAVVLPQESGATVTASKPGAALRGWYGDADFTGSAVASVGGSPGAAGPVHLYAKWSSDEFGLKVPVLDHATVFVNGVALTADYVKPDALYGESYVVKVVPDPGYALSGELAAYGTEKTAITGKTEAPVVLAFTMPAADVTVAMPSVEALSYQLIIDNTTHPENEIDPTSITFNDGATPISDSTVGKTITLKTTASDQAVWIAYTQGAGGARSYVAVDPTNGTFVMPAADVYAYAVTGPANTVVAVAGAGVNTATVKVNGKDSPVVSSGNPVVLEASNLDTGYEFGQWTLKMVGGSFTSVGDLGSITDGATAIDAGKLSLVNGEIIVPGSAKIAFDMPSPAFSVIATADAERSVYTFHVTVTDEGVAPMTTVIAKGAQSLAKGTSVVSGGSCTTTYVGKACLGDTVMLEAQPAVGVKLDPWSLTDADLVANAGEVLVFTMPANNNAVAKISSAADDHTVAYDANTTDVVRNMPADDTAKHGAKLAEPVAPERTGYTFEGWFTDYSLATAWDFSNDPVLADTVLYAKWRPNAYTVRYFSEGVAVADATGAPFMESAQYGQTITLRKAKAMGLARPGYALAGWAMSPTAAVAAYADGAAVGDLSDDDGAIVDLHAVWEPITYDIAYNANGGTGAIPVQTGIAFDSTALLSDNRDASGAEIMERAGYLLVGWSTDASDSVPAYSLGALAAGMNAVNGGTVTLFAVWTPTSQPLTVVVPAAAGAPAVRADGLALTPQATSTDPATGAKTYEYRAPTGAKLSFDAALSAGYENPVWSAAFDDVLGNSLTASVADKTGVFAMPAGGAAVTLFANAVVYDLTVPDPGTGVDIVSIAIDGVPARGTAVNRATVYQVPFGTTVEIAAEAKAGYALDKTSIGGSDVSGYWVCTGVETRGGAIAANSDGRVSFTMPHADSTAVPPTATLVECTVSFDSNGGTGVADQSVPYGYKALKPADPERAGYSFGGWYADSALSVAWSFVDAVTQDMTLYADWSLRDYALSVPMLDHATVYVDGVPLEMPLVRTGAHYGDAHVVKVVPDAGYELTGALKAYAGAEQIISGAVEAPVELSFSMPADDVTVVLPAVRVIEYDLIADTATAVDNKVDPASIAFDDAIGASIGKAAVGTKVVPCTSASGPVSWVAYTDDGAGGRSYVATDPADGSFTMPAADVYVYATGSARDLVVAVAGEGVDGADVNINGVATPFAAVGDVVALGISGTDTGYGFARWVLKPADGSFADVVALGQITDGANPIPATDIALSGGAIVVTGAPSIVFAMPDPSISVVAVAEAEQVLYTFTAAVTDEGAVQTTALTAAGAQTFAPDSASSAAGKTTTVYRGQAYYGDTVVLTANPATGTLLGGWTLNGSSAIANAGAVVAFDMPASDGTVAEIEATAATYQVVFDANTTDAVASLPAVQTVAYGDAATRPADPARAGYMLAGWFADPACTSAWNFDDEIFADLTFYAKWTPVDYKLMVPSMTHAIVYVDGVPLARDYVKADARLGESHEVRVVPDEGWELSGSLKAYGGAETVIPGTTDAAIMLAFDMPAADVTVALPTVAAKEFRLIADVTTLVGDKVAPASITFADSAGRSLASAPAGTLVTPKASVAGPVTWVAYTLAGGAKAYVAVDPSTGAFAMPAADTYVYAIGGAQTTVTAVAGTGIGSASVQVDGAETPVAHAGDQVALRASDVDEGFAFARWTIKPTSGAFASVRDLGAITDGTNPIDSSAIKLSGGAIVVDGATDIVFSMPDPARSLVAAAEAEKVEYSFTAIVSDEGAAAATVLSAVGAKTFVAGTPSSLFGKTTTTYVGTAFAGDSITLTATPAAGMGFSGDWTFIGGKALSNADGVLVFTMPASNDARASIAAGTQMLKVSFEGNGGSETPDQSVAFGASAAKPADPTRAGYAFDGWYDDAAFANAWDFADPITADTTLFAKWRPLFHKLSVPVLPHATVYVDGQPIATGFSDPSVRYGDMHAVRVVPNDGYGLSGSLAAYSGAEVQIAGTTEQPVALAFAMPEADVAVSLPAIAAIEYTVSADADVTVAGKIDPAGISFAGGVGSSPAKAIVGTSITPSTTEAGPATWIAYTKGTDGTTSYVACDPDDGSFDMPAADVYVYAVAGAVNTVTAVAGTGVGAASVAVDGVATPVAAAGNAVALSAGSLDAGHAFERWVLAPANGSFATTADLGEITSGSVPVPAAEISLEGGAIVVKGVPDIAFAMPEPARSIIATAEASPASHTFTVTVEDEGDTQSTTLVAVGATSFAPGVPLTSGGVTTTVYTGTAPYGAAITLAAAPQAGMALGPWRLDNASPVVSSGGMLAFDMPDSDAVQAAIAAKLNRYTVSFESNGGDAVAFQTKAHGAHAEEPAPPERAGWAFAGWYADPALTEAWDFASDAVTADMTLYADWEPVAYTLFVPALEHATVYVNGVRTEGGYTNTQAHIGDAFTVKVEPDAGWEASGSLLAYDATGLTFARNDVAGTTRSAFELAFAMPAADAAVDIPQMNPAVFRLIADDATSVANKLNPGLVMFADGAGAGIADAIVDERVTPKAGIPGSFTWIAYTLDDAGGKSYVALDPSTGAFAMPAADVYVYGVNNAVNTVAVVAGEGVSSASVSIADRSTPVVNADERVALHAVGFDAGYAFARWIIRPADGSFASADDLGAIADGAAEIDAERISLSDDGAIVVEGAPDVAFAMGNPARSLVAVAEAEKIAFGFTVVITDDGGSQATEALASGALSFESIGSTQTGGLTTTIYEGTAHYGDVVTLQASTQPDVALALWDIQGVSPTARYGSVLMFTMPASNDVVASIGSRPHEYTVAFDPNGGEGDMDTVSRAVGDGAALPTNEFEREGYLFEGWNTKSAGTGASFGDADTADVTDEEGATIILYAQWRPAAYTVAFEMGEGASGKTEQAFLYDAADALDAGRITPPHGKRLSGWLDAEGAFYEEHAFVKNLSADDGARVTLTAVWEDAAPARTYYLVARYDQLPDGASYGDAPTVQTVEFAYVGDTVSVDTDALEIPAGFHLDEENSVLSGTIAEDEELELRVNLARNRFTVKFQGGAADAAGTMADMPYIYGSGKSLPSNAFTRSGYDFDGWVVASQGVSTQVATDEEIETTDRPRRPLPRMLTTSAQAAPTGAPADPEPAATSSALGVQAADAVLADRSDASTLTDVDGDVVVLLAQWSQQQSPKKATISFDVAGGKLDGSMMRTGELGTFFEVPVPTRSGYVFTGWKAADGALFPTGSSYCIGRNATLTAQWRAEADAAPIKVDLDGGTLPDGGSLGGSEGDVVVLPTPSRAGYTFVGWRSSNGTMYPAGSRYVVADRDSLQAVWSPLAPVCDTSAGSTLRPASASIGGSAGPSSLGSGGSAGSTIAQTGDPLQGLPPLLVLSALASAAVVYTARPNRKGDR